MALLSILLEQRQILTESDLFSLSKDKRVLFHYTDFKGVVEILREDTLRVGFHNLGWKNANKNVAHKHGERGVSMTRNPHGHYWGSQNFGGNGACLILDANKLRQRYPIFPVSALDDNKRGKRYSDPSDYSSSDTYFQQPYMEEVVPRDIKNISRYVLGIGIEITEDTYAIGKLVNGLISIASTKNIQLYRMETNFQSAYVPKNRRFYKQDDPSYFTDLVEEFMK